MARVAPAAESFWAMPHAMDRLLASPNTTAVLPDRLIMLFPVPPRLAYGVGSCRANRFLGYQVEFGASAAQVHQLNLAGGPAEEAGAEALELVDGIGGEAVDLRLDDGWMRSRRTGSRLRLSRLDVAPAIDEASRRFGGRFCGVDYGDAARGGALDQGAQQRIVCAA